MATISTVNGKKITKIKYKGEIFDTGGSGEEFNPLQNLVDNRVYQNKKTIRNLFSYQAIDTDFGKILSSINLSDITDFYSAFGYSEIRYDFNLDTSKAINMDYMFNGSTFDRNITLDISSATSVNNLFANVKGISKVVLIDNKQDTYKKANSMFYLSSIEEVEMEGVLKITTDSHFFGSMKFSPTIENNTTSLTSFLNGADYMVIVDLNILEKNTFTSKPSDKSYTTNIVLRNCTSVPQSTYNWLENYHHFTGKVDYNGNKHGLKDGRIFVPDDLIEDFKVATNWSISADLFRPLSSNGWNFRWWIEDEMKSGETEHYEVDLYRYKEIPSVEIISSNENIATISNITTTQEKIEFDVNGIAFGETDITININGKNVISTDTKKVNVYEPKVVSVANIEGLTYGFTLQSDGYYRNDNYGNEYNTFSLCKITFTITNRTSKNLNILYKSSGLVTQEGFIFSNLDTELTQSSTKDTENVYLTAQSTPDLEELVYHDIPVGEHFIYVKVYRNYGGYRIGYLDFKVRE